VVLVDPWDDRASSTDPDEAVDPMDEPRSDAAGPCR
jgi:hypothetical protein